MRVSKPDLKALDVRVAKAADATSAQKAASPGLAQPEAPASTAKDRAALTAKKAGSSGPLHRASISTDADLKEKLQGRLATADKVITTFGGAHNVRPDDVLKHGTGATAKQRYRTLAMALHPDRQQGLPVTAANGRVLEQAFKVVDGAWDAHIKNPKVNAHKKDQYNRSQESARDKVVAAGAEVHAAAAAEAAAVQAAEREAQAAAAAAKTAKAAGALGDVVSALGADFTKDIGRTLRSVSGQVSRLEARVSQPVLHTSEADFSKLESQFSAMAERLVNHPHRKESFKDLAQLLTKGKGIIKDCNGGTLSRAADRFADKSETSICEALKTVESTLETLKAHRREASELGSAALLQKIDSVQDKALSARKSLKGAQRECGDVSARAHKTASATTRGAEGLSKRLDQLKSDLTSTKTRFENSFGLNKADFAKQPKQWEGRMTMARAAFAEHLDGLARKLNAWAGNERDYARTNRGAHQKDATFKKYMLGAIQSHGAALGPLQAEATLSPVSDDVYAELGQELQDRQQSLNNSAAKLQHRDSSHLYR